MLKFSDIITRAVEEYEEYKRFNSETFIDLMVIMTFITSIPYLEELVPSSTVRAVRSYRNFITHTIFYMKKETANKELYKAAVHLRPILRDDLVFKISNLNDVIW